MAALTANRQLHLPYIFPAAFHRLRCGHEWVAVDSVDLRNLGRAVRDDLRHHGIRQRGWCRFLRRHEPRISDTGRMKGRRKNGLGAEWITRLGMLPVAELQIGDANAVFAGSLVDSLVSFLRQVWAEL